MTMSALHWVLEKEAKDLEALHGQSDLSSWFFLESAEIGVISVNVTVSMTSRLLAAGQQLTVQGVRIMKRGRELYVYLYFIQFEGLGILWMYYISFLGYALVAVKTNYISF